MALMPPCNACGAPFTVDDEDRSFLEKLAHEIGGKKMNFPESTFCPNCRLQERLAWRVERNLYFRTCDLTGEKILSVFAPDSPYKAAHHEAWYSDKWNALDFGRDFDFSKPFFDQFHNLMKDVTLLALNVQSIQNCEYVNQCGWSKDCYFTIEADQNDDCMYGYRIFYDKTCIDCTEVTQSQWCYECVDCGNCYGLRYSQLCRQCADSSFLYDCRGCTNCFGCAGLRQKQHCMFNERLTPDQYQANLQAFDFCNPEHLGAAQEKFDALKLRHPRKAFIGEQNENVSGNYIYESKDVRDSYGMWQCRDCRYCNLIRDAKDCMDYFVWGDKAEKIYNCECCGHGVQNLAFCCDCWDGVHDLLYCYQCMKATSDCFGCIGVLKGKYCILNKQYSKEEYESMVPKIIEHMRKTGEWGQFLSSTIAPYAYNETMAQEFFPLTEGDARKKGLRWKENLPFTTGKETLAWDKVPWDITHVPDSIVDEVFACEATEKNYRITKRELQFYRDMHLPIPRFHHDERHRRRMAQRNPRRLWNRECATCKKAIQTSYSPDRPETVYCEECYLKEVY
jgi:hypothetical protein